MRYSAIFVRILPSQIRRGGTLSYYVDGALIGTKTPSFLGTVSNNSSLWIGNDKASNNTFNGNISQCRIWNIARTESEIAEAKDLSLEGNEAGLVAYWEMDNENGQEVRDKTGLYDGVLGNSNGNESLDPAWSTDGCVEEDLVSTSTPQVYSLSIAPNPTRSRLSIENPKGENLQVQVLNELGQLLFRDTVSGTNGDIDLSSYPKGMYFLIIEYSGQRFTEKVIKQ
ncbi:MAG: T9SS type A sorting domain-containing protein [Bacteroidota bacterium]